MLERALEADPPADERVRGFNHTNSSRYFVVPEPAEKSCRRVADWLFVMLKISRKTSAVILRIGRMS